MKKLLLALLLVACDSTQRQASLPETCKIVNVRRTEGTLCVFFKVQCSNGVYMYTVDCTGELYYKYFKDK